MRGDVHNVGNAPSSTAQTGWYPGGGTCLPPQLLKKNTAVNRNESKHHWRGPWIEAVGVHFGAVVCMAGVVRRGPLRLKHTSEAELCGMSGQLGAAERAL